MITRSGFLYLKSMGRFAGRPWVRHMFTLRDQMLVSENGQIAIGLKGASIVRPQHAKCVRCELIASPCFLLIDAWVACCLHVMGVLDCVVARRRYVSCIQIKTPLAMQYLLRAESAREADGWARDLVVHTGRPNARVVRSKGHAGPSTAQSHSSSAPEHHPSHIPKVAGHLYVTWCEKTQSLLDTCSFWLRTRWWGGLCS